MFTVSIVTYSKINPNRDSEFKNNILRKSLEYLSKSEIVSEILIIDNSKKPIFAKFREISSKITYKHMLGRNLGYGKGHNLSNKFLNLNKYHLILNPDIIFYENNCLETLSKYMDDNPDVCLSQPLICSYPSKEVQKLCKQNPSFLIQFIRLFLTKFLTKNQFLKSINDKYEMKSIAYKKDVIQSQYLSGCFMFCRVSALNKVGWFDERFFMYLEDADLTRMLSNYGKCVHVPFVSVGHLWAKESHTVLKLKLIAIYSFFLYSMKWGLKFI